MRSVARCLAISIMVSSGPIGLVPPRDRAVPPANGCDHGPILVLSPGAAARGHRVLGDSLRGKRVAGVYSSGSSSTGKAAHLLSDAIGVSLIPCDRLGTDRPVTRRLREEVVDSHPNSLLVFVLDADLVEPFVREVAGNGANFRVTADSNAYYAASSQRGIASVSRCKL